MKKNLGQDDGSSDSWDVPTIIVTDSLRIFGAFLCGLFFAVLAFCFEYAGQATFYIARGLMHVSDLCGDCALGVLPKD